MYATVCKRVKHWLTVWCFFYLLCRSKSRRWASNRQSFYRSTPGSSSCHRCHFYMNSHSEPPAIINNNKPRNILKNRSFLLKATEIWSNKLDSLNSDSWMKQLHHSPWTRGHNGIGRWRCHTPLHSHTDTAPSNRDRRNRERRSRYRTVPPTQVGTCILLSLGDSWTMKNMM